MASNEIASSAQRGNNAVSVIQDNSKGKIDRIFEQMKAKAQNRIDIHKAQMQALLTSIEGNGLQTKNENATSAIARDVLPTSSVMWKLIHIFGSGVTQMDTSATVNNGSLNSIASLLAHLKSLGIIAQIERLHTINIYNGLFLTVSLRSDNEQHRIEWDKLDAAVINDLVNEIRSNIK